VVGRFYVRGRCRHGEPWPVYFAAAADIYKQTVSSIYAFFKAMALYPEVAAEAQAEIDSVVGSDRLPTLADKNNLPYVNALVLEVMRWHAVAPTGRLNSQTP
jgi:cytochrome P450